MNELQGKWEQRWHPLRREWVVYSAHRNQRPWSGAPVAPPPPKPSYDPKCYLCPGNPRAGGERNPDYDSVFVFDNDFPVVGPMAPEPLQHEAASPFAMRRASGTARVVCYDPRHNASMASISLNRATQVFAAWREESIRFQANPDITFALIFENRGELAGVSNPHPHCQIYATNFTFRLVEQAMEATAIHQNESGRNLFDDILNHEQRDGRRIIAENESAIAFVPWFARYAYEVMVFPKARKATLAELNDNEIHGLADVFQQTIRRYDLLYGIEFPYVMSILQAPLDGGDYRDYCMHLLIQPPLRSPGLQKFLAGPEIGGGNFMADTMPEDKAAELRALNLSDYQELES